MSKINPIYDKDKNLADIEIEYQAKKISLLGSNGKTREINSLNGYKDNTLAVFLGFGFGYAIEEFLQKNKNIPICIIDKEKFYTLPEYKEKFDKIKNNHQIHFIDEIDSNKALEKLLLWQQEHDKKDFSFIRNSQYLRLDREYYAKFEKLVNMLADDNFWQSLRPKSFSNEDIKILFTEKSWLSSELIHACERLNIQFMALDLKKSDNNDDYMKLLSNTVLTYKPDMVVTFNHLGIDSDGVFMDFLAKLELPLASIFVDHPYLILHDSACHVSDWLSIFTYDEDNIESLQNYGYKFIDYMPLGTDVERFNPRNKERAFPKEWESEVSFVGTSMRSLVASRLHEANAPKKLSHNYKNIAKVFMQSPLHIVKDCIAKEFPTLLADFLAMPKESQLLYERVITWEATRIYRHSCVEQLLPFNPAIMGDKEWKNAFRKNVGSFRQLKSVSYFDELPYFYPHSTINFNTTSMQMKNAVNQRVFDVMACNSFIITDWRKQMDNLLESGKEIISYKEVGEIPELINFYLKNEQARNAIIQSGRKRIIAEHTWDIRLQNMIKIMQDRYKK